MKLVWLAALCASACRPAANVPAEAPRDASAVVEASVVTASVVDASVPTAPAVVFPDAGPDAPVLERARAMCFALPPNSDPNAARFVRLPLKWRHRVGSDACASGAVPCKYATRNVRKTDELGCTGFDGLDPAERMPPGFSDHVTTRGDKAMIESSIGQFPVYLLFEKTNAGWVLVDVSEEKPQLKKE